MSSRSVLTIDTATPAVSAGVVLLGEDGKLETLAERVTVDARAHAERLTPNIVAALEEAGLTAGDLDAIVVGCGPGPFTGLRVGMATAAAYGHALDLPVHGVCSLDAIGVFTTGDALVVTDARRREVYWARYRGGTRVHGPAVSAPAEVFVDRGDGFDVIAGSPEQAALVDPTGALRRVPPSHPTPAGIVRTVADWSAEPAPLVPLYLRRPDAKSLAERGMVAR